MAAMCMHIQERGSRLVLARGRALSVLGELVERTKPTAVFWNRRYEPAARECSTRVKEALTYERQYTDASTLLFSHVQGKPECLELLEEMRREEAQYAIGAGGPPSTAAGRPDQTGSFKAL